MKFSADQMTQKGAEYFPSLADEYYKFSKRWISEKGYHGVFADEFIASGSVIAKCGGRLVKHGHTSPEEDHFTALIAQDVYATPFNLKNLETFWFLNHSCSPNVARIGGMVFVAKKEIKPDEEVTIDYAPLVSSESDAWSMMCACGSMNCRKMVSNQDWQNPSIAAQLWAEWLPFIQKLILQKSFRKEKE